MELEALRERFFEGVSRYRYVETLGRGKTGAVFKALDRDTGRLLALKVFAPKPGADYEELLTRFRREVGLNLRIDHPAVARTYGFGTVGDIPFIEMEYVPGKTLREILDDEGVMGLEPSYAATILRNAAVGTHAAHAAGVLHRDLKPSNLMVRESGSVSVLDFGFARDTSGPSITHTSQVLGSPQYMAPELSLGEPASVQSDVYSLGVIAFEALTGHPPFLADNPVALALKHLSERVPDDLSLVPALPVTVRETVLHALGKRPVDRFRTAIAFADALSVVDP
ncbi:MAG TPA: serine/threonine-protein kinase [Thermoanaerobaculia bacterium]|jgi:serine/threonine protein kinase